MCNTTNVPRIFVHNMTTRRNRVSVVCIVSVVLCLHGLTHTDPRQTKDSIEYYTPSSSLINTHNERWVMNNEWWVMGDERWEMRAFFFFFFLSLFFSFFEKWELSERSINYIVLASRTVLFVTSSKVWQYWLACVSSAMKTCVNTHRSQMCALLNLVQKAISAKQTLKTVIPHLIRATLIW